MDEFKKTSQGEEDPGVEEFDLDKKREDEQSENTKKNVEKSFNKKFQKASFKPKKAGKAKKKSEVLDDVDIDEYRLGGGIKYKLPGRRQRMILSVTLFGLNALLLVAVILYFKVPQFHDFIINVGR